MSKKEPSLLVSLIPVVFLIALLVINILIYKDDATGGPNQLALFLAAVVATAIGLGHLKIAYKDIEKGILESIELAMQANLILFVVGVLIGLWILSGIVPTMIYYGIKMINPTVFLPVACLVCAFVSLATGSSWSTSGTVGIALIGVGTTLGFTPGMVAGAIISGAYFGDKMSPLSDTTNLAPAMAGTDLFTHIKHLFYTTVPSLILALIGFTILNFVQTTGSANAGDIALVAGVIEKNFDVGLHHFIVPAVVIFMVARKVPALPALVIGALLGGVWALLFQQDLVANMMGGEFTLGKAYELIVTTAHGGFESQTGNKMIDSLFSRGGMASMLNTVWLILMAMVFGGALEATGMLQKIAGSILLLVRGTGSLVGATLASCLFINLTASDQYLAIVVPGRMFRSAYEKYGLHPKNLSRSLEDAGTVTSVLIPWNSGGAYNSGVLGVATLDYLPYAFFNILSPIVSLFLASMGWTIEKKIAEKQA